MDREQYLQFMLMMESIRLAVIAVGQATLIGGGGEGFSFKEDSATSSEQVADEALRPLGVLEQVYKVRGGTGGLG